MIIAARTQVPVGVKKSRTHTHTQFHLEMSQCELHMFVCILFSGVDVTECVAPSHHLSEGLSCTGLYEARTSCENESFIYPQLGQVRAQLHCTEGIASGHKLNITAYSSGSQITSALITEQNLIIHDLDAKLSQLNTIQT